VRAGRAFLIKVKSHRGELINQPAHTLEEEGREISEDDKRWDDRTDRMTFDVRGAEREHDSMVSGRTVCATLFQNKRGGDDDFLFFFKNNKVLSETKPSLPPCTCLGSIFATTDKR
jgi:hypothetical protein